MAEWFAPKRYGWGSGRPITWQGWAVTLVYATILIVGTQRLWRNFWAVGSILLTATVIFFTILTKTTRGGWRWRWGGDE